MVIIFASIVFPVIVNAVANDSNNLPDIDKIVENIKIFTEEMQKETKAHPESRKQIDELENNNKLLMEILRQKSSN
jgi:predicted PurR-regulated permease PerM